MRVVVWSVLTLLLISANAASQSQAQRDSLPTVTPISPTDSARIVGEFKPAKADADSTPYRPTKSAGLALLLSAIVPGAGQFYNESYWKIPILVGFGYYFASQWIQNNDSTKHYRGLYSGSITSDVPSGNSRYQQLREFYKNQRDTFSWYIFIYYIVNLVDAYVDASLYDFNVGSDLSIHVRPEFDVLRGSGPQLKVKLNF